MKFVSISEKLHRRAFVLSNILNMGCDNDYDDRVMMLITMMMARVTKVIKRGASADLIARHDSCTNYDDDEEKGDDVMSTGCDDDEHDGVDVQGA